MFRKHKEDDPKMPREYVVKKIEKGKKHVAFGNVLLTSFSAYSSFWIALSIECVHEPLSDPLLIGSAITGAMLALITKLIINIFSHDNAEHIALIAELRQKLEVDRIIKSEGRDAAREYLVKKVENFKLTDNIDKKVAASTLITLLSIASIGYIHFWSDVHNYNLEAILSVVGSTAFDYTNYQITKASALLFNNGRTQMDLDLDSPKTELELKRMKED